jgi:hypothetical protein
MIEWKNTSCGSELQAAQMRLATTDQSDRGCGWVWHVHADDYSDQMACGGHLRSEDEAKKAAIEFVRSYCTSVLSALSDKPTQGGPTAAHPDAPYCKPDQSCCDFCCGN